MEVLLYGNINQFSARDFIQEVNAITDGVCDIRVNTDGGSPEYAWGMVAKFAEFQGEKSVKIDGKAYSMGAFLCAYADKVEALDVSEFMVHRAAYPTRFEKEAFNEDSEYYQAGLKQNLININSSLEKAFRAKVDVAKFEELKAVKVKDLFSLDNRVDVFLTAKEAKAIGLVDSINKITPQKKAEIDTLGAKIAAKYTPEITGIEPKKPESQAKITNPKKVNKMSIEDFKKENPEAYNAIVLQGVNQERERVKAHLVYADVDLAAVKEGIEKGEDLTPSKMAELGRKMMSAGVVASAEKDAPEATQTDAPEKGAPSPEVKALQDFEASVNAELGIEKK
jgi:ATP-dependent protease ClpP protease subunit